MNESSPSRRVTTWLLRSTCFLLLLLVVALAIRPRAERIVGWKTPIQFDDFAFEVLDVTDPKTSREPLILTLRVHNRAKRVPFQFKRSMATIVDSRGRTYRVSTTAQAELDTRRRTPDPLAAPLLAGTSATTQLAFDVPGDIEEPKLKLEFGPFADAIDGLLSGRKRNTLNPTTEGSSR